VKPKRVAESFLLGVFAQRRVENREVDERQAGSVGARAALALFLVLWKAAEPHEGYGGAKTGSPGFASGS
jgi:hypothetical protein